jgi:hypothetical protein
MNHNHRLVVLSPLLMLGVLGPVGCGSSRTAASSSGRSQIVETYDEPPGIHCSNGGVRIVTGTDKDESGTLTSSEIASTRYVCNGAVADGGAPSTTVLTLAVDEPAGVHCKNGGVALVTGVDQNGSAALETDEITATRYVCRQDQGQIVQVSDAGAACKDKGARITVGVDKNEDGVLAGSEIQSESIVCPSSSVLLRSDALAPNAQCPSGGTQISAGIDLDGDAVLSDDERTSSTIVCATPQTLVRAEAATSEQCPRTGFVLLSGADVNGDKTLSDSEVTHRQLLCVAGIQQIEHYTYYGISTCVVLTDGTVQCWGANSDGRLGNGLTTDIATPRRVAGLSNVKSVHLELSEGYAVHNDGTVSCWGARTCMTQVGSTVPVTPHKVAGLSDVEVLSAGVVHTCVLIKGSRVYCWGNNTLGKVLEGTVTTESITSPTEVAVGKGATDAAVNAGGT